VATFDFMQTLVLFHRGKQIRGKSLLSIKKLIVDRRSVNSGAAIYEQASIRLADSQHVPQKCRLNCG